MASQPTLGDVPLAWARDDIEQRMFFAGAQHTSVNMWLSGIMGLFLAVAFYIALLPKQIAEFASIFGGTVQHATVFLSAWSLAILFLKWRKLAYQKRALSHDIVPRDADFVLSSANVDHVIDRIYEVVDEPRHFVLFNRINVALANLKNLGRVGDVDEILRSQADGDDASLDTSYQIIGGFVWAIPVLGFIGTVQGLSIAVGEFGGVLDSANDISEITGSLKKVTGGLKLAFVTTLVALVSALVIQLLLTFLKKSEQEFLDECSSYCMTNVVNRLRIMPFA